LLGVQPSCTKNGQMIFLKTKQQNLHPSLRSTDNTAWIQYQYAYMCYLQLCYTFSLLCTSTEQYPRGKNWVILLSFFHRVQKSHESTHFQIHYLGTIGAPWNTSQPTSNHRVYQVMWEWVA
jgi:hypothetical protein